MWLKNILCDFETLRESQSQSQSTEHNFIKS